MRTVQLVTANILLLSYATPAPAYIDPGAGSVLLSLLIGFAVSASVALKVWWTNIRARASAALGRFIKAPLSVAGKPAEDGND